MVARLAEIPGLGEVGVAVGNSGIELESTYLKSFYWRIASRRGPNEARIATANKQIKIAFLIIRDGSVMSIRNRTILTGVTPGRPNAVW